MAHDENPTPEIDPATLTAMQKLLADPDGYNPGEDEDLDWPDEDEE